MLNGAKMWITNAPDADVMVHALMYPYASTRTLSAKRPVFDRSGHVQVDIRRAETGTIQRTRRSYTDEVVSLERRSLAGEISDTESRQAAAIPGAMIDLQRREATLTMDQVALQVEIEAAAETQKSANYESDQVVALAGNARWDASASDPPAAVRGASRKIQVRTGRRPNLMVVGTGVADALLERDDLRDYTKYVRSLTERPLDLTDVAAYLGGRGLRVVAAEAQKAASADDDKFSWVWPSDFVWLGVAQPIPSSAALSAPEARVNWGATLRLEGFPQGLEPWYDNDRTCWVYPVETYDTPQVLSKAAAFYWSTVVS